MEQGKKYQVLLLGPGVANYLQAFTQEMESQICALGLSMNQDVMVSSEVGQFPTSCWGTVLVVVWFQNESQPGLEEKQCLDQCLRECMPILPIVESLSNYPVNMPNELRALNAQEWEPTRVVADVLRSLRLTRRQRQVFISYKRNETRGVAVQLFEEFAIRGYRPFLDTASIEAGAAVQEALWARMADVDLLVFLDSPMALTSTWVSQELARAHALGLGILQLVWPGHQRTIGTEFSDFISLDETDFDQEQVDVESRLRAEKVAEVAVAAEGARIRSLAARRLRVVGDLVDLARAAGLESIVQPIERIEFRRNGKSVGQAVTLVGLPDARVIQDHEQAQNAPDFGRIRLVYNGLGIDPEWNQHLEWMNQHHQLVTTQIDLINDWLTTLN